MEPIRSAPSVAYCITCKGRLKHLKQTLPKNLEDNPHAKFVLLNYNSPDRLEDYLQQMHFPEIETGRLVVYRFTEPTPFRMAHAKNLAHRLGMLEGANVLVNLDADNYTGAGFDGYLMDRFTDNPDQFMWAKMVKNSQMDRGISGRICVPKNAFLLAGGYDERYDTWSPDDKDMNQRLRKLGFDAIEIEPQYLSAILHNDKTRFKEYPHAKNNGEDFAQMGPSTVVNGGRIGCGVVYRNFCPDPVEVNALPSRIFGIGMHKTATTSLHRALEILGYPSAHWKSAHWAKAIWDEMQMYGRSGTLEKHYALCDLPIPMMFRELDRAYPGSKFILTIRNEEDWVESVRSHWSQNNPFRSTWDHDPFTHRVHKLLYGQKWFDPDVMLGRYRQHNREVARYFRSRPADLLVMDMSKGAGWHELCGFLRKRIPDESYPFQFVSSQFTDGSGI